MCASIHVRAEQTQFQAAEGVYAKSGLLYASVVGVKKVLEAEDDQVGCWHACMHARAPLQSVRSATQSPPSHAHSACAGCIVSGAALGPGPPAHA